MSRPSAKSSPAFRDSRRCSEKVPLIGSMSQMGGLSNFSDDPARIPRIRALYRGEEGAERAVRRASFSAPPTSSREKAVPNHLL